MSMNCGRAAIIIEKYKVKNFLVHPILHFSGIMYNLGLTLTIPTPGNTLKSEDYRGLEVPAVISDSSLEGKGDIWDYHGAFQAVVTL